jgi:peptide/nickel transport system substrate-binding protein
MTAGGFRASVLLAAWLAAGAVPSPALAASDGPVRGGTLRLVAAASGGTIDPQVNYRVEFIQVFAALTDGLLAFRKAPGDAGYELVPDLAEALPEVTEGGRRYVFTLRQGVRFSDGRPVTVADVAASFRRAFRVHGPAVSTWFSRIEGGAACLARPETCTLPGLSVDAASRRITFRMAEPSADFPMILALPGASILPADTPPHDLGVTPFPTTGPYMIQSYVPQRGLVLVRNPYFQVWNEKAQPPGVVDRIDYRFGLTDQAAVTAVENDQFDWMYDFKPLDRLDEIGRRFAGRARISPMHAYAYLELNTRLAPFDRVAARQAVALAIDRRVIAALYGGPAMATPFCQMIPPGLPGHVPFCPFGGGPDGRWQAADPARARALIRAAGAEGAAVTLVTTDWPVDREIGLYVQGALSAIGLRVSLRSLSPAIEFTYISNSANRVSIGLTAAEEDYPAPSAFAGTAFLCDAWRPNSDTTDNMTGFCDPAVDQAVAAAQAAGLSDAGAAAAAWARVDRLVTEAAPLVPLFLMHNLDIVSSRLRNYEFSPIYHMLIARAAVRG